MSLTLHDFENELYRYGLIVDRVAVDGKIHRCSTSTHPNKKNGWYCIREYQSSNAVILYATYGDWGIGIIEHWCSKEKLSPDDKKYFLAWQLEQAEELKKEQQKQQLIIASEYKTFAILKSSHPYLDRKKITRILELDLMYPLAYSDDKYNNNNLIVPVMNIEGQLQSYQKILANKSKMGTDKFFAKGGITCAGFYPIHEKSTPIDKCDLILLGEGFATMASIYLTLANTAKICSVIAFSKGNLEIVYESIKNKHPNKKIILIADNDIGGDNPNYGVEACQKIQKFHPKIQIFIPQLDGKKCDANDVYIALSEKKLYEQFNQQIYNIPLGFSLREDGLFCLIKDGKENKVVRIGNYLTVKGKTTIDNVATLLLEFRDSHDNLKQLALSKGMPHSPRLGILLGEADYIFNPLYKSKLAEYLSECNTANEVISTMQIGWHENSFILPHKSLGNSTVQYCGRLERNKFLPKGNLLEWIQYVAKHCAGNPIMEFVLYFSLSAPLTIINNGIGVHLAGQSSNGKTTALKVASSVWGNPQTYLKKWNATHNAIELHGYNSNHVLCPLDEINEANRGTMDSIYTLVDGIGKSRGISRVGGVEEATLKTWKTAVLSTGEQTIEDMFVLHGKNIKAGETVRMIDILVENICSKETSEILQENIKQYYGVAGEFFINYLISNNLIDKAISKQHKIIYSRLYAKYKPHSQASRVLFIFVLSIVSGDLAIESGLLSDEFTPEAVCCMLFEQWFARNQDKKEEQQIIELLKSALDDKNNNFVDVEDIKSNKPNIIGIYNGNQYYLIPSLANKKLWQKNSINPQLAWDILEKRGMIEKLKDIRTNIGVRKYTLIIM